MGKGQSGASGRCKQSVPTANFLEEWTAVCSAESVIGLSIVSEKKGPASK